MISALVIGPSLVVLNRLPNRTGSRRVEILSSLLFWMFLHSLVISVQNTLVLGGIFRKGPKEWMTPLPRNVSNLSRFSYFIFGPKTLDSVSDTLKRQARTINGHKTFPEFEIENKSWEGRSEMSIADSAQRLRYHESHQDCKLNCNNNKQAESSKDFNKTKELHEGGAYTLNMTSDTQASLIGTNHSPTSSISRSIELGDNTNKSLDDPTSASRIKSLRMQIQFLNGGRTTVLKPDNSAEQMKIINALYAPQPFPVVLICWITTLGIRVVSIERVKTLEN